MNLKSVFILLFLFTTVMFVGCYTKLGYYEPVNLKETQHKQMEKTEKEEIENGSDTDIESEGYYGRRKRSYRSSYPYAGDSYRVPYAPYMYYPPVYYYPQSWYYGYGYYGYPASYYRYYRGYYPYTGYYGSYYGSRFRSVPRRSYKGGAVSRQYRSGNRRARASRSVTSSNPRSERPQRRLK